MKAQKYFGVVLILALLFALVPAMGVSAAGIKVDVCHFDKDANIFFLINNSENAYDSHLAHGDAAPGESVPGMAGMIFADDCTPTIVVTGTWNGRSGTLGSMTYTFSMTLVQADDLSVTGTIYYQGLAPRPVTGFVSGNTFTFTQTNGPSYSATVSGDVVGTYFHGTGTHTGGGAVELEATKAP